MSFSYQRSGSPRRRIMTLDALEFIRRFLQHVLPTRFMKVRYYGFFSPSAKIPVPEVIAKVALASSFILSVPQVELPPWPTPPRAACGGRLRFDRSAWTPSTGFLNNGSKRPFWSPQSLWVGRRSHTPGEVVPGDEVPGDSSFGREIWHKPRARMAVNVPCLGASCRRNDYLVTEEKPHIGREAR